MRRRLPDPELLIPLVLLLAGAAVLLTGGPHARGGFPLDDAWIHRVYARALAHFQGFAYDPGQQETGATSPLWAIVSAPCHWLQPLGDGAVIAAVKALALALAAAAVLALTAIGRRLTGSRRAGVVAACVLAASPRLAFAALSGMETPLALALLLGGTAALLSDRRALGCALLGLSVTARPEMAVVAGPTVLIAVTRGGGLPRAARDAALALTPIVLWVAFCLAVTGRPLPATFYVKAQPIALDAAKLAEAWRLLAGAGWWAPLFFPLGLAAAITLLSRRRDRAAALTATALIVGPLLFLIAVVGGRQVRLDGYYWTRWADPPALALTAAAALGFGAALARAGVLGARRRVLETVLAAVTLAACLPALGGAWLERRARLESDSAAIERMNVAPARWLAAHTPPAAVIGVNDAGALRYFSNRRVLDLVGLNTHKRAFGELDLNACYRLMDWIAVFPAQWEPTGLLRGYSERKLFTIPLRDYTICDCPSQTTLWIGERPVAATPAADDTRPEHD